MSNKLRQVTDSIHGTIYLSTLESEFISTPYFYRLHDIYQSSTVYMTYPSNRTKRYEHSLGTMEIASNMLFSAISNSDRTTRERFFSEAFDWFNNIYNGIMSYHNQDAAYLHKASDSLDKLFGYAGGKQPEVEDFFKNEIKFAYRDGVMEDHALDQFQFYAISTKQDRNLSGMRDTFIYRCVLEAIRLVALFHDVGHPPYSHIIEDVINALYKEVMNTKNGFVDDRRESFLACLKPFLSDKTEEAYRCKMLLTTSSLIEAHTHERIGLALLQSAVNEVIPDQIRTIFGLEQSVEVKRAQVLYIVTVVEMALAILTEKSDFFKSLHQIVDGFVDADRLDYVVRDSKNSGVDWGRVPYKRLIQACKLVYLDQIRMNGLNNDKPTKSTLAIAFPNKSSDDITDMLVARYKIFARINYHHRCIKTGAALKACVKDIALDYLQNKKSVFKDIAMLWESLENARAGNIGVRIIQWNDSWLISTLHKALIQIPSEEKYQLLRENLEEILLNKKKYYGLLKRGDEQRSFAGKLIKSINVNIDKLKKLNEHETEKLKNSDKGEVIEESKDVVGVDITSLFTDEGNARDSLERLDIINSLTEDGDLSLLETILPLFGKTMEEVFDEVLTKMKEKGVIRGFQIYVNSGREKNGIPKHENVWDHIFLYNDDGYEVFDENYSLIGQLEPIQNSVPLLNVYYIPEKVGDVASIRKMIVDEAVAVLGSQYILRKKELFGNQI